MEEGVYYVEILGCVILYRAFLPSCSLSVFHREEDARNGNVEVGPDSRNFPATLNSARHVQEDEGDLPETLQSGKSCKLYLNGFIHVFLPYRQRSLTARTMLPSPRIS